MPAARPSPTQIRNALTAWTNAGLTVGRLTIRDGEIIIEAPVAGITERAQTAAPKQWRTG